MFGLFANSYLPWGAWKYDNFLLYCCSCLFKSVKYIYIYWFFGGEQLYHEVNMKLKFCWIPSYALLCKNCTGGRMSLILNHFVFVSQTSFYQCSTLNQQQGLWTFVSVNIYMALLVSISQTFWQFCWCSKQAYFYPLIFVNQFAETVCIIIGSLEIWVNIFLLKIHTIVDQPCRWFKINMR